MGRHRPGDRTARAGALPAALWLVALSALDVLLPADIVPDPLFALAPLIACSVLRPRATAAFGAGAIALLVASGWWNAHWGTEQQ